MSSWESCRGLGMVRRYPFGILAMTMSTRDGWAWVLATPFGCLLSDDLCASDGVARRLAEAAAEKRVRSAS